MEKISWGVLSTAKIGLEKVSPAMQKGESCEMAAKQLRCISFEKKIESSFSILTLLNTSWNVSEYPVPVLIYE